MGNVYEGVGIIDKVLGNNNYQVLIAMEGEEGDAKTVLCHLSGKMRRFRINVISGDEVMVEVPPPYDKGRITFRGRKEDRVSRDTERGKKKGNRR